MTTKCIVKGALAVVSAAVFAVGVPPCATNADAAEKARPAGTKAQREGSADLKRPTLETHRGRYFRWAAPAGWKSSETTNGVELFSPDGRTRVMFALLMRSQGNMTPRDFLLGTLPKLPGYGNVRLISARGLPEQRSGIPGTAWKVIEADLSYTYGGAQVNSTWTSGVNGYYGMYDAMLLGYQAPAREWPQARLFLPAVARSITITNPGQVAGNDRLIMPRNNPLDNSALLRSWREKGLSEDRISKARREGTSGYERLKDTQTGRIYEMPLEAYDPTLGGYRNPVRPTERLHQTQPGE